MCVDGMVFMLGLTIVLMIPILIGPWTRPAFLAFISGMLIHFTLQFLLGVALEEARHRRNPKRRRWQISRVCLLVMAMPPFMAAYFP